jgi:RNase adaptor protein for sRNA GlmZ degradation
MNPTPFTLSLYSFSYKKQLQFHDISHGGGYVFDCRCITNPGRLELYKKKTGLDKEVAEYIEALNETASFFDNITSLVLLSIHMYIQKDYSELSVGFGCTGGQHRSVYFTEKTAAFFRSLDRDSHSKHLQTSISLKIPLTVSVNHLHIPQF